MLKEAVPPWQVPWPLSLNVQGGPGGEDAAERDEAVRQFWSREGSLGALDPGQHSCGRLPGRTDWPVSGLMGGTRLS